MSQTLTLPDELYGRLAQGAEKRGLTIESLLDVFSGLIVQPKRPTKQDRDRARNIERLFAKNRKGPLTEQDRGELDRLIDAHYQEAMAYAGRLIKAKETRQRGMAVLPRTTKRTRK